MSKLEHQRGIEKGYTFALGLSSVGQKLPPSK
jgi:hypothetical protein